MAGYDSAYVVLYVSPAALPVVAATAERRYVVKVGIRARHPFELLAVVDTFFATRTENQPVFMLAIAVRPFK